MLFFSVLFFYGVFAGVFMLNLSAFCSEKQEGVELDGQVVWEEILEVPKTN